MLKQTALALAIAGLASSAAYAAAPNVVGGSSDVGYVETGPSTFPGTAPADYAGISMLRDGGTAMSGFVNIAAAPVNQVRSTATANAAGPFFALHPQDLQPIAQVWLNTQHDEADILSLRQVRYLAAPGWPHFSGLAFGQVKYYNSTLNQYVPYAMGDGVYFGEWARDGAAIGGTVDTAEMKMDSASHTVWFVGDNAVTSMPTLVNATYAVVGIGQTGTDALGNTLAGGLPHAPNLYQGTLTANYSGGSGTLAGSINRTVGSGTQSVSFAGTNILSDGSFNNGISNPHEIRGQFYNNANALAGIAVDNGAGTGSLAFGGHRQ